MVIDMDKDAIQFIGMLLVGGLATYGLDCLLFGCY